MEKTKHFRITARRDGQELGEGAGRTKAEALLDAHRRLGFFRRITLARDGKSLDFVKDPRRMTEKQRMFMLNVRDCAFQVLA
jgi:hypothetical protein